MGNAFARHPLGLLSLPKSELMIPSLRVMQTRKKEKEKEIYMAEMCEDLEGLDEKREEAQERSLR